MTETADPLKAEIKQAIVRSLRLPITAEEIGDSTPLFADGLGLDSIDVLELVLEIERCSASRSATRRPGCEVLRSVDTIAEFILAAGPRKSPHDPGGSPGGPGPCARRATPSPSISRNGFTSAASAARWRPSDWDRAAGARRADDAVAARSARSRRSARDVLRRRLDRRAISAAGRGGAGRRSRNRLARLSAPARLRARRGGVQERSPRQRRRAERGRRRRRALFPRAGVVGQRPVVLGARHPRRRRVHGGCEHGAAEDGRVAALSAASARTPHGGRADSRSAAARRRSIRAGDAARMGMGTAHELAAPGAARDRSAESFRAARRPHRPPVGARSGSAARAPSGRAAVCALLPPRPASRTGCGP